MAVKLVSHCFEAILPSCVPELDVERVAVFLELGFDEVDADGTDVVLLKLLLIEHLEDGGLSDLSVPDYHDVHFRPTH